MAPKKFTPREAAQAVLKKASELYQASSLAKSEQPLAKKYEGFKAVEASAAKSGAKDPAAVAAAVGMKKYGKKHFEEAAHAGKKMHKMDDMEMSEANPDEAADAKLGEEVEKDVAEHEAGSEDPKHEMPMKGHIKLAKFMGAMEAKRGQRPR